MPIKTVNTAASHQSLLKPLAGYWLLMALLSVVITGAIILSSQALGHLTDVIQKGAWNKVGIFAGETLLYTAAWIVLHNIAFQQLCAHVKARAYGLVEKSLGTQIVSLPLDHSAMYHGQDTSTYIETDADTTVNFLSDTMSSLIYQTVRLFFSFLFIWMQDVRLFAIYAVMSLVAIALQGLISKTVAKAAGRAKQAEVDLNDVLMDVLSGSEILAAHQADAFVDDLLDEKQKAFAESRIRIDKAAMPLKFAGVALGLFPLIAICLAALVMIPSGSLQLSVFLTVYYLCQQIITDQLHYADLISECSRSRVSLKRLEDYFKQKSAWTPTVSADGSICFEHVSYRYPGTSQDAIHDISFTIAPGTKTALIGASGSGKSTAMAIAAGLKAPAEGRAVAADGAIVPQRPYMFQMSLKDNITLGNGTWSRTVLDASGVSGWMEQLEQKENTVLRGSAANLSGGQKQMCAIARALSQQRGVIFFDESLSAVDAANADRIMAHLCHDYPDTTMVFILHQPELLSYVDQVICFDHGTLCYQGDVEGARRYIPCR